jgi:hypothetical protein
MLQRLSPQRHSKPGRGWCARRRRSHPRPIVFYGTIFSTSPTSGAVL